MAGRESKIIEVTLDALLPAALLEEVFEDLRISDASKRAWLEERLQTVASSYSLRKDAEPNLPTAHETRADMEKAARELRMAIERIERLPPGLSGVLSQDYRECASKEEAPPKVRVLIRGMKILQVLAQEIGNERPPKRSPARNLIFSVGALMLILERFTSQRTKSRRGGEGRPPELASVEAQVIGKVLRSVDPLLQTNTLVNVIEKLNRTHPGDALEAFDLEPLVGLKAIIQFGAES